MRSQEPTHVWCFFKCLHVGRHLSVANIRLALKLPALTTPQTIVTIDKYLDNARRLPLESQSLGQGWMRLSVTNTLAYYGMEWNSTFFEFTYNIECSTEMYINFNKVL